MRRSFLLGLALVLLSLLSGERVPLGAAGGGGWGFRLSMLDLSTGLLDIEMALPTAAGPGREPLSLCLFMDGAGEYVRELRLLDAPAGAAVGRDPDDGDCWTVRPSPQGGWPRRLAYRLDLGSMAARRGEPDYAEAIDATYVWNEQAVLLHPSPLPRGVPIAIELLLPPGTALATPWREVRSPAPSPVRRFDSDSEQHDHGSYIVFGRRLRELGPLSLPGGEAQARLFLIDLPHRASDSALRGWMAAALSTVAGFYRELLPKDLVVTLVPLGNSRSAGLYGSVLRPLRPSAQIFFGGGAETFSLSDDWLATHELFHVGNPFLTRRLPWLVEGFTTYYEMILRARAGALPAATAWGELASGFSRHCQPEGGRSLSEDSTGMRTSHNYQRVYWGGACVAFMLDVAIRGRASASARPGAPVPPSGAKAAATASSLDDVMRELRRASLIKPLGEAEVLAVLDAAAGGKLASRLLGETQKIAVDDVLRRLGVSLPEGRKPDRDATRYPVVLSDSAPLVAIRRALF